MHARQARSFFTDQAQAPFWAALFITGICVFLLERSIMHATGGVLMYPLDDPYIHMQLARNLAGTGTWGMNPGEFASASSSLLYTILLASLFKIFSAHVMIPFLINCIAAFFLLYSVHAWLLRQAMNGVQRLLILLTMVVLIPLPVLVISGMEHTLQALFTFLFLTSFSELAGNTDDGMSPDNRSSVFRKAVLFGMLMIFVRYEGVFIAGLAGLILLYKRRFKAAFIMGGIALLPIVLFGLYSISKGSYFFPNSVLVKADPAAQSNSGILQFISNTLIQKLTIVKAPAPAIPGTPPPGISLLVTQRLLIILPVIWFLFGDLLKANKRYATFLFLLTGGTLLHLMLAATGWFYRYEAYLLAAAIPMTGVLIGKAGSRFYAARSIYTRLVAATLAFALFFPFMLRAAAAFSNTKQACLNIYSQQYQMAEFVRSYYNDQTIALNDIGAVSFFSGSRIVDLWGLGNIDIARSKKGGYNTPAFADSLVKARHTRIAIVYDDWFGQELLRHWTKAGTWQIRNNVICGSDIVSFYAIDPADAAALKEHLIRFGDRGLFTAVTAQP